MRKEEFEGRGFGERYHLNALIALANEGSIVFVQSAGFDFLLIWKLRVARVGSAFRTAMRLWWGLAAGGVSTFAEQRDWCWFYVPE